MYLNPKDIDASWETIKKKNKYIEALRRKMKFPTTKHPQTQEIGELEKEKESLLSFNIEQYIHIQNMEENMKEILKQKEKNQ